jgi:hypothetical protein
VVLLLSAAIVPAVQVRISAAALTTAERHLRWRPTVATAWTTIAMVLQIATTTRIAQVILPASRRSVSQEAKLAGMMKTAAPVSVRDGQEERLVNKILLQSDRNILTKRY